MHPSFLSFSMKISAGNKKKWVFNYNLKVFDVIPPTKKLVVKEFCFWRNFYVFEKLNFLKKKSFHQNFTQCFLFFKQTESKSSEINFQIKETKKKKQLKKKKKEKKIYMHMNLRDGWKSMKSNFEVWRSGFRKLCRLVFGKFKHFFK